MFTERILSYRYWHNNISFLLNYRGTHSPAFSPALCALCGAGRLRMMTIISHQRGISDSGETSAQSLSQPSWWCRTGGTAQSIGVLLQQQGSAAAWASCPKPGLSCSGTGLHPALQAPAASQLLTAAAPQPHCYGGSFPAVHTHRLVIQGKTLCSFQFLQEKGGKTAWGHCTSLLPLCCTLLQPGAGFE